MKYLAKDINQMVQVLNSNANELEYEAGKGIYMANHPIFTLKQQEINYILALRNSPPFTNQSPQKNEKLLLKIKIPAVIFSYTVHQ